MRHLTEGILLTLENALQDQQFIHAHEPKELEKILKAKAWVYSELEKRGADVSGAPLHELEGRMK